MSAVSVGFGSQRTSSRPAVTGDGVVGSAHLRMTSRGRAVLLTVLATPLVIIALVTGINAGAANGTSSSTPLAKVTIVGGETLWGLAHDIAPNADPRDVVANIMSVNQLKTADIQAGERLSIPAQYSH
jgi:LysM domain